MSEEKREDFLGEIPAEAESANWDLHEHTDQPDTTDFFTPVEETTETTEATEIAEDSSVTDEVVDIFLPEVTESLVAEQVPVDVLANHEFTEPEPVRRSFDFSQLTAETASPADSTQAPDVPENAALVESADSAAEDAVTEIQYAPAVDAAAENFDFTAPSENPTDFLAVGVAEVAVSDLEDTSVERKAILGAVAAPAAEASQGWQPRLEETAFSDNTTALVLGSTSLPLVVPSRVAARVWSFFLTLLLAPTGWYMLTDGAARFVLADEGPFQTGIINLGALIEFAAGIVIAIVILAFLVRSSLGALSTGLLLMVAGLPFIVVPGVTKQLLQPTLDWLVAWNSFGGNLAHHLNWTGYTGVIFVSGLLLFTMGIMAILARRDGRKEQQIRSEIEQYAPTEKKNR